MQKTPEQILQETIIKTLDSKNLDSGILSYFKAEISSITEKEVLVKIADKINEEKFLENLSFESILAFITSVKKEVGGIIEKQDGVSEHKEAVCTNALEVMSHSIIIKAIKGFYIYKLTEEKDKLEETYGNLGGWDKYSIEIIFAIEYLDDFLIYLFEKKYIKENDKFPDDKLKLILNILSTIEKKGYFINLKTHFEKIELANLDKKNISIFGYIKNWKKFFAVVDLKEFFKVVDLKEFFKVVDWKEFFKVVDWKEFFKVVDLKEFFEVIKIKELLEYLNIILEKDEDNDITINYKNKILYQYYKTLYIKENFLFMEDINSNRKFNLNLQTSEKTEIEDIPNDTLQFYDKDNGGFSNFYE